MNKFTNSFLLCFILFISGCTSIKVFPDELNIYGRGEKHNLSNVLKLLEEDKKKNSAVSIVLWKKSIGYKSNEMERSWGYGISREGKTCKDAILSSLKECFHDIRNRQDNPFKQKKFGGCYVFAIKCKNLKKELNFYNKIEFLDQ
ncbi:hypothetical protein MNBD_GAMMA03-1699 [hydrothermal vent metagenome]|uniref:Lipoprotein n=1 Tax=hydrothermal vent metagenome TaxID=652676 RepID=A0A3B0WM62_9ZZZZ